MTIVVIYEIQAGDDEARIKREIEAALIESVKKIMDAIADAQVLKYTSTSNPPLPAGSRYERTFELRQSSETKITKATLPTIRGQWRATARHAADVIGSRAQQAPLFANRWKSKEDVEAQVGPQAKKITQQELENIK